MLLNVFEPVIVNAPAPPWFNVQLNVEPPPINVLAVAAVMEIAPTPVPAVVVNPDGATLLNVVALAPEQTTVPPLKVKFFVAPAVINLCEEVLVYPAKSNVPLVNVSVEQVNALPNDQPPPTPLKLPEIKTLPWVVIVLPVVVALNVVVPVYVREKFVVCQNNDPLTVNPIFEPARVIIPSRPDAVKSLQTLGVSAIVTVKLPVPTFELASK